MGRHLALAPENPPNPPAPEWHPASNGRGREAAPCRACDPHACTRAVAAAAPRNASTADSRNRSTFDPNRTPASSPARWRRNTVSGDKPR
jgi:hypothetical protein